jgi:hypothetical protein
MPYFEPSRPMPLSFMLPKGGDLGRDDDAAARDGGGDHLRETDRNNDPAALRTSSNRLTSTIWLRKP